MTDGRTRVDQKVLIGMSRWKTKESSIGRRTELARRKIELDEIIEIGRGLVVQCIFKGRNSNSVLTAGFERKPGSTRGRRYNYSQNDR